VASVIHSFYRSSRLQPPAVPTFELYGPAGLRSFVRNCLFATRTRTAEKYAVHELLTEGDVTTSCAPEDLHGSEAPGRDIRAGDDGFWRECINAGSTLSNMIVDAGPIIHRGRSPLSTWFWESVTHEDHADPCIGYILREASAPFRKLVILGDTNDPSAITPLVLSLPGPPSSLLIHEATDAYIPPHVDYKANRTVETVMEKCLERAHSTPVHPARCRGRVTN
jgi:ribonuclease Z